MDTKKIIILDFKTQEVHIFPYDGNIYEEVEDFFEALYEETELSFGDCNCQWMVVDELKIEIH